MSDGSRSATAPPTTSDHPAQRSVPDVQCVLHQYPVTRSTTSPVLLPSPWPVLHTPRRRQPISRSSVTLCDRSCRSAITGCDSGSDTPPEPCNPATSPATARGWHSPAGCPRPRHRFWWRTPTGVSGHDRRLRPPPPHCGLRAAA